MTPEAFEKLHTLTHYRDAAGQAQEERRRGERRGVQSSCSFPIIVGNVTPDELAEYHELDSLANNMEPGGQLRKRYVALFTKIHG
jgi:hypothetical protein